MSIPDNRAMATKKPKGLGLGLEALLGPRVVDGEPGSAGGDQTPRSLPLDRLQVGRYQPRVPRFRELANAA